MTNIDLVRKNRKAEELREQATQKSEELRRNLESLKAVNVALRQAQNARRYQCWADTEAAS